MGFNSGFKGLSDSGCGPVASCCVHGNEHSSSVHGAGINLLKTKHNLLYVRNQSVPRSKHFPPRLQNQLMMYTANVAVCSDIRTKYSTRGEHHV